MRLLPFFMLCFFAGIAALRGVLASEHVEDPEECDNPDADEAAPNTNKIRVVTKDELSTKIGVDSPTIWISILGEVYDVTTGSEYYAQNASYGVFAGRDASVPFISGTFTPEEADKSPLTLKNAELIGLVDWLKFYKTHETYRFIGYLEDERYFDSEAKPTIEMLELGIRLKVARQEQKAKEEERARERQERKKKKEQ